MEGLHEQRPYASNECRQIRMRHPGSICREVEPGPLTRRDNFEPRWDSIRITGEQNPEPAGKVSLDGVVPRILLVPRLLLVQRLRVLFHEMERGLWVIFSALSVIGMNFLRDGATDFCGDDSLDKFFPVLGDPATYPLSPHPETGWFHLIAHQLDDRRFVEACLFFDLIKGRAILPCHPDYFVPLVICHTPFR
jgi:hypothetical protein